MLQDPNVERYVENAIKPLKKEIAKLKLQIEELNKALRKHDVRHSAMKWWNTLSSAGRTRMCDIHTELVGNIRRLETLTGKEVQMIYEAEHLA